MTDGRLLRGARTRTTVLDAAVATASVDGLEGMSLGQLAAALGVSKSGLFAHWPDKQQLQLDVVDHARRQWIDRIVEPALARPSPLEKLWALHERRLRFYADRVLPGGCFFAAVKAELDDRPGPVRDALVAATDEWLGLLERLAGRSVATGQLRDEVEPGRLAFEIEALGEAVVLRGSRRRGDAARLRRYARRAVLDRLRALATDPSLLPQD